MYNKYHWVRDFHDARDYYVETTGAFKLTSARLPDVCDLRSWCTPVENQGTLGSCTGHALVGAVEYMLNRKRLQVVTGAVPKGKPTDLSRLFVYYNERVVERTVKVDAGAQIKTGVQTLVKVGVPVESLWPYAVKKFSVKPTKAAYDDAAKRKVTTYARVSRVNGVDSIRRTLASGYPVVFGFDVYSGFDSEEVAQTGVLDMPGAGETLQGGHAVLIVGYNHAQQRFVIRNSWGSAWGQGGYFTMPYAYVASRKLASDFWTITS